GGVGRWSNEPERGGASLVSPATERRRVSGQRPSLPPVGVPLRAPTRRSCRSGSTWTDRPQRRAMGPAVSRARRMADETTAPGRKAASTAAIAAAWAGPRTLRPPSDSAPRETRGAAGSARGGGEERAGTVKESVLRW